MKYVMALIIPFIGLISCDKEEVVIEELTCGVNATVLDLTGLDGCSFILELENGDRLEPIWRRTCGTPPLPENSPVDHLIDFEFHNGQIVNIVYENANMASICMVGTTVFINCIAEVAAVPIQATD